MIFDTESTKQVQILVEYVTDTGSAFAVTPQGDTVFLNARLVNRMNVEAGDVYNAFLLPNYPDKRDDTPWRAMRVELAPVTPMIDNIKLSREDQEMLERAEYEEKEARIVEYMREYGGASTVLELSTALDLEPSDVQSILDHNRLTHLGDLGSSQLFMKVDAYMLLSEDN